MIDFCVDSLGIIRMRYATLVFLFLGLCSASFAQDVIEKTGKECPSGYRDGKGHYCYSNSSTSRQDVIAKTNGQCPRGYRDGKGQYCYNSNPTDDVIVKQDKDCPQGYRDGPGHYCYD